MTLADLERTAPTAREFPKKASYGRGELLALAHGEYPHVPRLPAPPYLLFDRITEINGSGGTHGKGLVRAELDLRDDLPFFLAHFVGDPVMPGKDQLDAILQMLGFFGGWSGANGKGRATGVEGPIKFLDEITPGHKRVEYVVNVSRLVLSRNGKRPSFAVGDGEIFCDGKLTCTVMQAGACVIPQ